MQNNVVYAIHIREHDLIFLIKFGYDILSYISCNNVIWYNNFAGNNYLQVNS